MNKQELIEKLAKRISPLEDFRGISGFHDGNYEGLEYALNLLQQLDEPQKPVVPNFVADWFEEHKDDLEWSIWKLTIDSNTNYTKDKKEMRHWIQHAPNKPYRTLIAMLDGYDVEKEPLYIMPVPHVSFSVHYCVKDDHISFRQGNAQKFTQAELDRYFPDIKRFAVPVEEV